MAFLDRPIEQTFPYLFVDTSHYKVRNGPRYVSKALLVTAGVREDGYGEVLGATIGDRENEAFWSGCFADLKKKRIDRRSPRHLGWSPGDPGSRSRGVSRGIMAGV
ncbi:Transposase, Mutator family [anaerobic digester metagenome]